MPISPCDSFNLYPTEKHERDKFSFYNQCLASLLRTDYPGYQMLLLPWCVFFPRYYLLSV